MRNGRYILIYIIAILCALLLVTGFGYVNYKNTSFEGLSRNKTYNSGRRVKYADLYWYVIREDDRYVTLILAENAKVGNFGDTNIWKDSDVKEYLNEEWINDEKQAVLSQELEHGALLLDSSSKTFIRLIKVEELMNNPIKNDSETPYWTMSAYDDKVWYALEGGYTEYTSYNKEKSTTRKCYEGENKLSLKDLVINNEIMVLVGQKTIVDSLEMNAVTAVDIEKETSECSQGYKIENGLFHEDGEKTTYISDWNLKEEKEVIGIRPVITVKKK